MKITRKFTKKGQDAFATSKWTKRASRIANPDGTVVFEMGDAEVPASWSQLATDIMVSKYFRKAGVPQALPGHDPVEALKTDAFIRGDDGKVVMGPERSAKQVIHRLAGCWRHWGETHGYFESADDAQARVRHDWPGSGSLLRRAEDGRDQGIGGRLHTPPAARLLYPERGRCAGGRGRHHGPLGS